jgi:hypothetical protein
VGRVAAHKPKLAQTQGFPLELPPFVLHEERRHLYEVQALSSYYVVPTLRCAGSPSDPACFPCTRCSTRGSSGRRDTQSVSRPVSRAYCPADTREYTVTRGTTSCPSACVHVHRCPAACADRVAHYALLVPIQERPPERSARTCSPYTTSLTLLTGAPQAGTCCARGQTASLLGRTHTRRGHRDTQWANPRCCSAQPCGRNKQWKKKGNALCTMKASLRTSYSPLLCACIRRQARASCTIPPPLTTDDEDGAGARATKVAWTDSVMMSMIKLW